MKVSHAVLRADEQFVAGPLGWVVFYRFTYDGEPFEYVFEVGGPNATERQARESAVGLVCRKRAEQGFLRDVELKERH